MGWTFVGSKTASITGSTSSNTVVSLSGLTGGAASSPSAGDIVIVAYATKSNADRTLTVTDGSVAYSTASNEVYSDGSADSNLRVLFKVMPSTPDANVTIGPTGDTGDPGAAIIYVLRGQKTIGPIPDATAATASGTGTDRPNPGAVTPTDNGSRVLVVGAGASQYAGTALTDGASLSNYVSMVGSSSTSGHWIKLYAGLYAWTSGTYDPAASTGGDNDASGTWCALTITIKPAPENIAVARSDEADTALAPSNPGFAYPLGRSDEVDASLALTARADGRHASETDAAFSLSALAEGQAGIETDTALALLPLLSPPLSRTARLNQSKLSARTVALRR